MLGPSDDAPLGVRRLQALRRTCLPRAGRGTQPQGHDSPVLRLVRPRNHPSWWGGPQAAFFEALLDGQTIEIHGDGQQTRTFTYVDDTVEGIYRSIITPEARGEVLNIGANTPTTIYDLAVLVQKTLGIRLPLRARIVPYDELPGRYQDVRHRVPDTTKAKRLLGFEAKRKLAEGLERTAEWHQARRLEKAVEA